MGLHVKIGRGGVGAGWKKVREGMEEGERSDGRREGVG